ncbi:MAG: methionyl-tRNA formyltransferase [Dehalococcoidia bacterium]
MSDGFRPERLRVLFMGSPEFAVPSLRALVAAGYNLVCVVTQPDRPSGRGGKMTPPPVKMAAEELRIPVFQPEELRSDEAFARLQAFAPDLVVVAAYGKILSRRVLQLPTHGAANVHASLLPRWRGASPINAAILAGDAETGVSIMEMVQKMDAGPVLAREAVTISSDATTGTLEPVLADLGARTLVEVLPAWLSGKLHAEPQDEARVTFCSLIKKQDGFLAATMTAAEAERAVRAFDPWPGAFVLYRGDRLAIWRARVLPAAEVEPGATSIIERLPALGFRDGWLLLDEVQRVGARRVDGRAFLNGERGVFAGEVVLA